MHYLCNNAPFIQLYLNSHVHDIKNSLQLHIAFFLFAQLLSITSYNYSVITNRSCLANKDFYHSIVKYLKNLFLLKWIKIIQTHMFFFRAKFDNLFFIYFLIYFIHRISNQKIRIFCFSLVYSLLPSLNSKRDDDDIFYKI